MLTDNLQLASNFVTFFEKLSGMLESLSTSMPQYAEILALVMQTPSERLKISIRHYYVDLFDIFRSIARVFTKRDGGMYAEGSIYN
jgi:hypothetical protein